MEFSVLFEGQTYPVTREREQEVLRSGVEQAVLADELGFDRFYAVEHHSLEGYAHSSAPEVLLSFIAARTKRIRIAHGVVPLPFKINHPVRVAERAATLDILSNGRLDLGVGRSSSRREQEIFGVSDAASHQEVIESLKAIVQMWTEPETAYESDILSIPKRTIRPFPLQTPHPRMMMACTRDDTFGIAARLGLGALSNAADGPTQAARKRQLYDEACAARTPDDLVSKIPYDHMGATVFTCVRDDAEEARNLGLRGYRYFMETARHWFSGGSFPDPSSWRDEENEPALRAIFEERGAKSFSNTERTGAGLLNTSFDAAEVLDRRSSAMGSPTDCIAFVESMEAAGVDECYFVLQLGGLTDDIALESIRQIGEYVIPHFRSRQGRVLDLAPTP